MANDADKEDRRHPTSAELLRTMTRIEAGLHSSDIDHEARIRFLERLAFAFPASLVASAAAIVVAFIK